MSWDRLDPFEHEPPFDYDDRPCAKCIHRYGEKCGSDWECCYEEEPPMSLEDAIAIIQNEVDVDYDGMSEQETDRIDKAFDLVIAKARAYMNRDCAEWVDWIDGATGRKTDAGTCSKCGKYNKWKSRYCPSCGRQMKEIKKGE